MHKRIRNAGTLLTVWFLAYFFPSCSSTSENERTKPIAAERQPDKTTPKAEAVTAQSIADLPHETYFVLRDTDWAIAEDTTRPDLMWTGGGCFQGVLLGTKVFFVFKDAVYAFEWIDVTDEPWQTRRWRHPPSFDYSTLGEYVKGLLGIKSASEYNYYALVDKMLAMELVAKPPDRLSKKEIRKVVQSFTEEENLSLVY